MVEANGRPFILGIGGTARSGSSTESALQVALLEAGRLGAEISLFGSAELIALPHYLVPCEYVPTSAHTLLAQVRRADGIILASPGYHGTISALVKNAIDHLEETARDARVYLDGVPVGLIATAYGWQAGVGTLATMRAITHSLRGWPTPLGVAIKTGPGLFDGGGCTDADVMRQLQTMGSQVASFAFDRLHRRGEEVRAA